MIWLQKDNYYRESDAGYRVCRAFVGDVVKYTASVKTANGWLYLGTSTDAGEMNDLCDNHYQESNHAI